MITCRIPRFLFVAGGLASVLSGILLAAGFMLHPAGEDATFGTDPLWVPAHGAIWLSLTISLLGWVGIYIAQASMAGRIGIAGFAITLIGAAFVSWIFSSDVIFVPTIAAKAPALFEEIFGGAHLLLGVGGVLVWVLGQALFGYSTIRAKIFPGWAGILLILGSLAVPAAYLAGLPEKVVAAGGSPSG